METNIIAAISQIGITGVMLYLVWNAFQAQIRETIRAHEVFGERAAKVIEANTTAMIGMGQALVLINESRERMIQAIASFEERTKGVKL